ncbi:GNAT family protein [Fulvivirgaceae bacterium BMA12]|uniref:GNAT family protein n=1 Tax=Agaribacillus aureus TaxID=3051825 RepID=A0ABT8L4C1_9BACT|nr:GNAT family protein [Fulvivirgaceae bacterium BMA12]
MIEVIETKPQDIHKNLKLENDPENRQFIFPYSHERHLQVIENRHEFHFSIFDRSGVLVGFIVLALTEREDESLEFRRIVIGDKGKGYGRAAVRWVKAFCFKQNNYHRLWLDVFSENHRAFQLYKSEGFEQEGIIRECIKTEDGWKSLILMSIIKGK